MTPEHIGSLTVALAILTALIQVVRSMTKVSVTVDRLAIDMTVNTTATTKTADKVSDIDSRVSRVEGKLGIGRVE
jgi:hypothetical protein